MIRRIGVIVQGPNDYGLLMGLRDRLGCDAEFVPARIRGKNRRSVRRDALNNWRYFQQKGVDLVVRLTDSDSERWQDVLREERQGFPEDMRGILVCGVTEGTVELWLTADRRFLESQLGIPRSEHISDADIVGRVKSAFVQRSPLRRYDEAVQKLVREAPPETFRQWLRQPSLRDLYEQCRDAALREHDCLVHDELRDAPDA